MIRLLITSVVLSIINGIHITYSFSSLIDVKGIRLAICGSVGPIGLCFLLRKNDYFINPAIALNYYYLIMSIIDVFTGGLVLWKILSRLIN
jgi:hypothetical protein